MGEIENEWRLNVIGRLWYVNNYYMDISQALTVLTEYVRKGGLNKNMPKPLKYGEGSITKRKRINKKGSIYEWYEVKWYDEYGKQQTRTSRTQEDARRVLSQFNKRSTRNTRKQTKMFGTYFMEWFETFGKRNMCKATEKRNLCQISRIPKEIMKKPICQVTSKELQDYLDFAETEYGGNPKWWTSLLFKAFIKHAFNEGHIKSNIGALLIAEQPTALRVKNHLPRELEEKFLSFFAPSKNSKEKVDYRPYVKGLIYTGCRISEFMTIGRYEDTQIANGMLRFRETKSIREKDRKRGINYVIREFPILPPLENYKFPLPELTHDRLQYNFRIACKKLGLKLTPHDMRRTCQSRCNELGIAESVSMQLFGWKTKKMVHHYTNNTKELLEKEFARLRNSTNISTNIQN